MENADLGMYCSYCAGGYYDYDGRMPVMSIELPMDNLNRGSVPIYMTHDEMIARVQAKSVYHWYGQVFRNYNRELDMYITYAGDPKTYHYQLKMPEGPVNPEGDDLSECDPYPATHQFYMATGKILKGVYTAEEWAAWAARMG